MIVSPLPATILLKLELQDEEQCCGLPKKCGCGTPDSPKLLEIESLSSVGVYGWDVDNHNLQLNEINEMIRAINLIIEDHHIPTFPINLIYIAWPVALFGTCFLQCICSDWFKRDEKVDDVLKKYNVSLRKCHW